MTQRIHLLPWYSMRYAALLVLLSCLNLHCGGGPASAREVVRDFFGAIRSSDTTYIKTYVLLASAAEDLRSDLIDPARDTSAVEPDWGKRLFSSLVGEGALRARWLDNQIVIGEERRVGDTAFVQVSYLDRVTRVQYLTEMKLINQGTIWRIVDFQAND